MKVKEAMSKDVVTISPEDSLETAIDVFSKNHISGAPVIDTEGRLIGILSESDIIKGVGIKRLLSFDSKDIEKIKKAVDNPTLKVEKIMIRTVHSVKEEDDIDEAINTMNTHDINRLPVVDEKGRLSGILTRGDVIRAVARQESYRQEMKSGSPTTPKGTEPLETGALETEVDKFLKIIEERGSITVDKVAKLLSVPQERVEEWGRVFEEHKLVKLEYPPLGKPVLKKIK